MKYLSFSIFFMMTLVWGLQNVVAQGQSLSTVSKDQKSLSDKNSAVKFDWKAAIASKDTSNEFSQSKLVDFRLDFKLNYQVNSDLKMDLQPLFKYQTGSQQTLQAADKSDTRIVIKQAAVHYSPVNFAEVSAGALNQKYSHAVILVDEIAFPTARLQVFTLGKDNKDFQVNLLAETAMPTSSNLSPNTNEFEKTPAFNTFGVRLKNETNWREYTKLTANYFSYENLPRSVAASSYTLGNTVNKISDNEGVFEYEYKGIEATALFRMNLLGPADAFVGGEFIQNQKAPSGLNKGYQAYLGGEYFMKKSTSIDLKLSTFRVEPDAAVAYFTPNELFNTNRVGYWFESRINFYKDSYRIGIRYSEAQPLFESNVQSHEKSLLLKLETTYAEI